MSGQLGRHYSSPEHPIRGDVPPPAPGQAYFGYPQPGADGRGEGVGGFGVPQQQTPAPGGGQPGWPLAMPAPSTAKRPYRAHSSHSRSRRIWLHLVGYSLVAIAGTALGVAVAHHGLGLL